MRTIRRALLLCLVLLPALAAPAFALGIPSPARLFEELIAKATGGSVVASGISGWPNSLHFDHLELRDEQGAWLLADDVSLDWHPYLLVRKRASIDRFEAARVQMPRLRAAAPSTQPAQASDGSSLPVSIQIRQLRIARAEIGAPVLGTAAVLSVDGNLDLPTLETPVANLVVERLDAGGRYAVDATVTEERIDGTLEVTEPERGLIAHLASLPDIGPLSLNATASGPRNALTASVKLAAGPLNASAQGKVDLAGETLDLQVSASAPAMTPAPGTAWQSIELQARVTGPFTKPDATGRLQVAGLAAAGAAVAKLAADLDGNAGRVSLHAVAEGVRVPGPDPDLFAASPLTLEATARLDDKARPVTFALTHPLLSAKGQADTAGTPQVTADVALARLAPLAAIGGIDLQGSAALHLHAVAGDATSVVADGTVSITGGLAPAPGLVGEDAKLGLTAEMRGQDLTISRFDLAGRTLRLGVTGGRTGGVLDADVSAALTDLAVLAPTLSGAVEVAAKLHGPLDDLAVTGQMQGEVGAPGVKRGPVKIEVALQGLPGAPNGTVKAQGTLADAPLDLAVTAKRGADGTVDATIDRADWRSLHAEGALRLPQGATLPLGRVQLRMGRLDDLRPFVGQPLSGAVTATVELDPAEVRLQAEARDAGIPGTRVGRASVTARVADPLKAPVVTASANLAGIEASGVTGSAKLDVSGPQDALSIRADAGLSVSGTPSQIAAAAVLDMPGKKVRVASLQAETRGETARLLTPATIAFGDTVAVDRLRVGLRQAVLDVSGELSPRLNATATLRAPADLAAIASPELALDGAISLDAKLTGTPAQPGGTVRLQATGVRMRTGPGRAVPPANLTATVQLAGQSARIDARVAAGSAQLNVNGQTPLGAGALNLRATGGLDLTLLDPILTAGGRQARGRVTLDASITGTAAAPRVAGTAQLAGGEIQDFTQGLRIRQIAATVRADGDTVRIVNLTGRAGPGTIGVKGSIGVLAPGLPLDLVITASNARPISSDQLQLEMDANLTLRGQATDVMNLAGRILVRRAEIRIPERLPPTVAALNVIRPGQKAVPVKAGPTPSIALDLQVNAPQQVFVRGRGVEAEMSGMLRIRGSASKPQVAGGFEMRRGQIGLAGTTLTFSHGKVGFDGTGVNGKIDPTLDFAADSTANSVTATLAITGYASAPKIKLSSVPDLPQDEVLAYLLFRRSIKELGPFQYAEIVASLAQLTGVGGGDGLNPLESVRKGLGLDRLSVGAATSGSGASVEAGRYVANGVYLGAKQGTSGTGTGATLQIDITKGLKLETDVGTGSGGNQVGVTYQFEY